MVSGICTVKAQTFLPILFCYYYEGVGQVARADGMLAHCCFVFLVSCAPGNSVSRGTAEFI